MPGADAVIPGGSEIILYFGEDRQETSVAVPDVIGKTAKEANRLLTGAGLYMKVIGATGDEGTIVASTQSPQAGEIVESGTVIEVEFSDLSAQD